MVEDDGEGGGEVRGEEEEGGGVFWGRGGLVKVGEGGWGGDVRKRRLDMRA